MLRSITFLLPTKPNPREIKIAPTIRTTQRRIAGVGMLGGVRGTTRARAILEKNGKNLHAAFGVIEKR